MGIIKVSVELWPNEVCDTEKDTWESRENLKNTMKLVEEFKKEYHREEEEEVRQQEKEEDSKMFRKKLLGRYIAKLLYR